MYHQEIVADNFAGIFSVNLFRLLFIKKHYSELLSFENNKKKLHSLGSSIYLKNF